MHALQARRPARDRQAVSLPVTATYLTGPPGSGDYGGPASLGILRIDSLVVAFLLLAAVDHLAVGGEGRAAGTSKVARGINPARWWEYSISASLMVVLIAMLAGITEVTALVALFGVNAAMILFGLAMERANLGREEVDWRPFVIWLYRRSGALDRDRRLQIVRRETEGEGVPGFVFAIFVLLFLLFNSFALNMWLQYRGRGRWADPLFAERVYLVLSLVAKSALAWLPAPVWRRTAVDFDDPGAYMAETRTIDRWHPPMSEDRGVMTRERLGVTLFLVAAASSFVLSIALWFTDNQDEAVFVGLWVPSILAAGGFWMVAVRTR